MDKSIDFCILCIYDWPLISHFKVSIYYTVKLTLKQKLRIENQEDRILKKISQNSSTVDTHSNLLLDLWTQVDQGTSSHILS